MESNFLFEFWTWDFLQILHTFEDIFITIIFELIRLSAKRYEFEMLTPDFDAEY